MKKTRYKVVVPPPTAKRMVKRGKVVVTHHYGWMGDVVDVYDLNPDSNEFEFEVTDDCEWLGSTKILDGSSFSVRVEYSNKTGTRTAECILVPEKVANLP